MIARRREPILVASVWVLLIAACAAFWTVVGIGAWAATR